MTHESNQLFTSQLAPPSSSGAGFPLAASSATVESDRSAELLLRSKDRTRGGTVMIVDDEPVIISVTQKYLRQAGYEKFITTSEPREAIHLVRSKHPDVIVLDVSMPHVSGLHILEVIRGDRGLHHLPVIVLTASEDEQVKQRALELGATDFLLKPIKPTELVPRIRSALVIKAHHDQMAEYSARLDLEVRYRTAELAESRRELIHVLATAAEYRDEETGNHVLRVGRYAGIIARQLRFSPRRAELIEQAAVLHDVGKIGITDAILYKPGKLAADEIAIMQKHCQYGRNILNGIPASGTKQRQLVAKPLESQSPILRLASTIANSHHERWDGSGYPQGLAGEAIPIEGRITAVADVFDALSSRRPYKAPMPLDRCFDSLEEGRAKHFDPKVLDAFFAGIDDVVHIFTALSDES